MHGGYVEMLTKENIANPNITLRENNIRCLLQLVYFMFFLHVACEQGQPCDCDEWPAVHIFFPYFLLTDPCENL